MAKLHHTQTTKLEALGASAIWNEDREVFQGSFDKDKRGIDFAAPEAKAFCEVAALNKTCKEEYPALVVSFDTEGGAYALYHSSDDFQNPVHWFEEGQPELTDVLEVVEELELELGTVEYKEVVPQKYKILYAERGNPNHCGDWLALWLSEALTIEGIVEGTTKTGKPSKRKKKSFDLDGFRALLDANGVDMSGKWAHSQARGWQGRFRMNGRQLLEIRILEQNGVLFTAEGEQIQAPAQWLQDIAERHGTLDLDEDEQE